VHEYETLVRKSVPAQPCNAGKDGDQVGGCVISDRGYSRSFGTESSKDEHGDESQASPQSEEKVATDFKVRTSADARLSIVSNLQGMYSRNGPSSHSCISLWDFAMNSASQGRSGGSREIEELTGRHKVAAWLQERAQLTLPQ
jgi:hypothetical protein